jgi:hypothetical protein
MDEKSLPIRSAEEGAIIWLAIREYCDRRADAAQREVDRGMGGGFDVTGAIAERDKYRQARVYYADCPYGVLTKLLDQWENEARARLETE